MDIHLNFPDKYWEHFRKKGEKELGYELPGIR